MRWNVLVFALCCVPCLSGCPEEDGSAPASSVEASPLSPPNAPSKVQGITVSSIEVENVTEPHQQPEGLDIAVAEQVSQNWFDGDTSAFRRVSGATDGGLRLKISLLMTLSVDGEIVTATQEGTASVGVVVEALEPVSGDVPRRYVSTIHRGFPYDGDRGKIGRVFSDLLQTALVRARQEIQVRVEVWRAGDREVVQWLDSGNPARVQESIRAAGERKIGGALPLLLPMLDADGDHVYEAVGAVSSLKDPKALKALSNLTSTMDPQLLQVVVYAIADIGGDEADRYLKAIALGNPSPTIRALAEEILTGSETP